MIRYTLFTSSEEICMASIASVIENIVPVSDFSHGKAASIFRRITNQVPVTVVKNNRPVAVITTPEEFAYLSEAEENIVLLEMALERLAANKDGSPIPEDAVLEKLGLTQQDLDAIADSEIEFE